MESILQDILWGKVLVYIYDIIVFTFDTLEDCLMTLDKVLCKLGEFIFKVNRKQSVFSQIEGEYLGFHITPN